MRRQYFYWTYLVLALVLTIYGGYIVFYNLAKSKDIPVLAIVFFAVGVAMLIVYLILLIINLFQKKKKQHASQIVEPEIEEEPKQEKIEPETKPEEKEPEPIEEPSPKPVRKSSGTATYKKSRTTSSSGFRGGSAYIRKVGYGPVLRVENDIILDMRSNEYYRIEGNMVNKSGSGPVFEISGNRIRSAFGGYLYEISGGSVNKTYGGFYASIDDSSIQVHDLSERYEISDSLNLSQKLAVVALLFERH